MVKAMVLLRQTLKAQAELLKKAYQNKMPSYIECHGTGTALGDPIEVNTIQECFPNTSIQLGSVKTQFGHTKAIRRYGRFDQINTMPSQYYMGRY